MRGITFDLWHTVVEEPMKDFSTFLKQNRAKEMNEALHRHGLEFEVEDVERAYDMQGKRLWHIWGRGVDIEQRAQIGILLSELGLRHDDIADSLVDDLVFLNDDVLARNPPVPFDGASELLSGLREKGLKLAIISNTGRTGGKFFRGLMETLGLAQYFDVMTFSNEVGVRKPNREIFLSTLAQLDVPPSEAMHVGDDYEADILGAQGAGMKGVLLLLPGRPPHQGSPDFVVSDLAEVGRIIEELEGDA